MNPRDTKLAWQRRPDVLASEMDGELVLLDVSKGHCFGLNKTGAAVWNLLAERRSFQEICSSLVQRFEIEPAECEEDVAPLLKTLAEMELIQNVTTD